MVIKVKNTEKAVKRTYHRFMKVSLRSTKWAGRENGSPREAEAEDVIDLGAPRAARRPAPAHPAAARVRPPNPRLYPGIPLPKPKARHRREVTFRALVPNARLYRPPAPRAPPPPAAPRVAWPPPAPLARLDTASGAALRLAERRRCAQAPLPRRSIAGRRARPSAPRRRQPAAPSAAPLAMEASRRHSASPEDCSEGNETLSAPSEFLAEFLSAIMQRQYAEALKYCRLILQYEPRNATARGFYPLLRHKAARAASPPLPAPAAAPASAAVPAPAPARAHSQSSLDSSDGLSDSSLSLADSSGARWDSGSSRSERAAPASRSGSASGSRSDSTPGCDCDRDDNGNEPSPLRHDDVQNDNASSSAASAPAPGSPAGSLQRLRAQFARCK